MDIRGIDRNEVWALIVVLSVGPAFAKDTGAQTSWTYRVRIGDEAAATGANTVSPFFGHGDGSLWDGSNLIVATADSTWTPADRLHLGGGVAMLGVNGSDAAVRVRQAYARVSATSWLDVEAGKRLVRWGTGYAFTPTGPLDPPRRATDPQDRLGLNEGMALVQATMFRGDVALTVAAGASNLATPRGRAAASDCGEASYGDPRLRARARGERGRPAAVFRRREHHARGRRTARMARRVAAARPDLAVGRPARSIRSLPRAMSRGRRADDVSPARPAVHVGVRRERRARRLPRRQRPRRRGLAAPRQRIADGLGSAADAGVDGRRHGPSVAP